MICHVTNYRRVWPPNQLPFCHVTRWFRGAVTPAAGASPPVKTRAAWLGVKLLKQSFRLLPDYRPLSGGTIADATAVVIVDVKRIHVGAATSERDVKKLPLLRHHQAIRQAL